MQRETERLIDSILARVDFAAIQIPWKTDNPLPTFGERKSAFRGLGTEFFELDYYQDGDDIRHIDWLATAKMGRPMKVVHQEDRQVLTYALVNIDHSMDFGTHRCSKRMLAAEVTASIFYSVNKSRDKAGSLLYSRRGIEGETLAGSVVNTVYPALTSILETRLPLPQTAKKTKDAASPNGDGLAKALSMLPQSRSLVFIISDFVHMSERDWRELANAAAVHDVAAIFVQDIRERELPKVMWPGCAYEMQDYDGQSRLLWNSGSARRKHRSRFQQHESAIVGKLKRSDCPVLIVSTEEGDAAMPRVVALFSDHA